MAATVPLDPAHPLQSPFQTNSVYVYSVTTKTITGSISAPEVVSLWNLALHLARNDTRITRIYIKFAEYCNIDEANAGWLLWDLAGQTPPMLYVSAGTLNSHAETPRYENGTSPFILLNKPIVTALRKRPAADYRHTNLAFLILATFLHELAHVFYSRLRCVAGAADLSFYTPPNYRFHHWYAGHIADELDSVNDPNAAEGGYFVEGLIFGGVIVTARPESGHPQSLVHEGTYSEISAILLRNGDPPLMRNSIGTSYLVSPASIAGFLNGVNTRPFDVALLQQLTDLGRARWSVPLVIGYLQQVVSPVGHRAVILARNPYDLLLPGDLALEAVAEQLYGDRALAFVIGR